MSQKRRRSEEPPDANHVFRSAPIDDRQSTFIGLFSPSLKPKELQSLEEIKSASHKIIAWRRESNQQAITGGVKYTIDHDDDGEKYAGKKVEKVLENMQATGSCVVARWYGGVMLGPARFEHIENCAREAVQKWKDSVAEELSKKRKIEQDAADGRRLIKTLAERDQSITVLRALAVEKEEQVKMAMAAHDGKTVNGDDTKDTDGGIGSKSAASDVVRADVKASPDAKATIDYASLPVERLKMMEKARDATLSFLLKRIDKAEIELVGATGKLPDI